MPCYRTSVAIIGKTGHHHGTPVTMPELTVTINGIRSYYFIKAIRVVLSFLMGSL